MNKTRHYELDWLRGLMILLLIPLHTAVIFATTGDSPLEGPQSRMIGLVNVSLDQFLMPVLFFIAGASTLFALRSRSPFRYLVERASRLLVPLVIGIAVLLPAIRYFALLSRKDAAASFFDVYPGVFTRFPPGYLWFVLYLFVFSVVLLPLFLFLRGERGGRFTSRLGTLCARRGGVFLFFVPLFLFELGRRMFPESSDNDVARLLLIAYFVYGYLAFSDVRIQRGIERIGKLALVLAGPVMAVFLTLLFVFRVIDDDPNPGWILGVLAPVAAVNPWLWIVAFLSLGKRYLSADSRPLRYLNQASYPIYLLHLPIMTVAGAYVLRWHLALAPSFFLIATATLAGSFAIYDLIVRRTAVTCYLFGVKTKRKPVPRSVEAERAA